MTFSTLLRKPGAFAPLAMSLAALALIAAVVATVGNGAQRAAFAGKWLPRAPRPALLVLLRQGGAALLAIATIVWLES